MAITSFCADVGYEMVSAVLPGFLATIGVAAEALGWIEGAADAVSSFVKLGAGWYSDRIGTPQAHRGARIFSFRHRAFRFREGRFLAAGAGREIGAWFGKGIRSPLRDAMLSDSIAARSAWPGVRHAPRRRYRRRRRGTTSGRVAPRRSAAARSFGALPHDLSHLDDPRARLLRRHALLVQEKRVRRESLAPPLELGSRTAQAVPSLLVGGWSFRSGRFRPYAADPGCHTTVDARPRRGARGRNRGAVLCAAQPHSRAYRLSRRVSLRTGEQAQHTGCGVRLGRSGGAGRGGPFRLAHHSHWRHRGRVRSGRNVCGHL